MICSNVDLEFSGLCCILWRTLEESRMRRFFRERVIAIFFDEMAT